MKLFRSHYLFITLALATVLVSSCHKDKKEVAPDKPTAERAGIYILNQGGFNDNGTLTYYDYTTKVLTPDIFSKVNGRKLGVLPNDIKVYGSKMYITVDKSGVVEVLDAKTAKSIKRVLMRTEADTSVSREPRSIIFYKSKALISEYDGTVAVLDTATLSIDKYITVGRNPEQMTITNGKLYVANSGGLTFDAPDSTVSVVDLNTFTEIKKVNVTIDPVAITADNFNNVYVLSYGKDNVSPAGMTIIDAKTDVAKPGPAVNLGASLTLFVQGDFLYYPTLDNSVAVYNSKTQTAAQANFIADGTTLQTPYALSGDSQTGEIFVTDAFNYTSVGKLFAFDKNGKKEYAIDAGVNPGSIVLVNK